MYLITWIEGGYLLEKQLLNFSFVPSLPGRPFTSHTLRLPLSRFYVT